MLFHVETSSSDFGSFVAPLMILGLGMSQLFVPLTVASVGAVPADVVPDAAAFTGLARQLGGSVSTAILVTIAQRTATSGYAGLANWVTLKNSAVAAYVQQSDNAAQAAINLFFMVQSQAAVIGYAQAAFLTALVSVILAPLALLLGNGNPDAAAAA